MSVRVFGADCSAPCESGANRPLRALPLSNGGVNSETNRRLIALDCARLSAPFGWSRDGVGTNKERVY